MTAPVIRECRRWMFYALGGGLGHLNRAVSLARAVLRQSGNRPRDDEAERLRNQICLLTNSPFADGLPIQEELGPGHEVVVLSPELSREETAEQVHGVLSRLPYDVLVVDTFPRGLGGELHELLSELDCCKFLVHRDLNPRYVAQFDFSRIIAQYDKLLMPGESAPFESSQHAVKTAPWLIRDDCELPAPSEARQLLEVESDVIPVVAVIGCGKMEEVDEMHALANQLAQEFESRAAIRFVSPQTDKPRRFESGSARHIGNLWPFLQAIRGVSVLVGSGGYNTVHEARATGTRFIGLPRNRLYDRQHQRLRTCVSAANLRDISGFVAESIAAIPSSQSTPPPAYSNGVYEAIEEIESLFR